MNTPRAGMSKKSPCKCISTLSYRIVSYCASRYNGEKYKMLPFRGVKKSPRIDVEHGEYFSVSNSKCDMVESYKCVDEGDSSTHDAIGSLAKLANQLLELQSQRFWTPLRSICTYEFQFTLLRKAYFSSGLDSGTCLSRLCVLILNNSAQSPCIREELLTNFTFQQHTRSKFHFTTR